MRIKHEFFKKNVPVLSNEKLIKLGKSIENLNKPIKLSICMIVRSEEKNLKELLPQLGFADEVVIVDTNIIDRYGNDTEKERFIRNSNQMLYDWSSGNIKRIVFDVFPWTDSFSEARNYAKSKCTGDMILWIDADDRVPLETAKIIRSELDQGRDSTVNTVHYFDVVMTDEYEKRNGIIVSQPRLFPNIPDIKWSGRVHETINESCNSLKSVVTDLKINHTGYSDHDLMIKKNERNLRLLLMSDDSPQKRMDLGNCYQSKGIISESSDMFLKSIDEYNQALGFLNITSDFRSHINYQKGVSQSLKKEYSKALESFKISDKIDSIYGQADCLLHLESESESLLKYIEYVYSEIKTTPYGSNNYVLRSNAYKMLIRIITDKYKKEYKLPTIYDSKKPEI